MKPLVIGLLPCGSLKRDYSCPAKDMYLSGFFRGARRYVERNCDDWLVVTTKYGPCFPEQIIAPYDDYLGKKPRKEWRIWFDWIFPEPFLSMAFRYRKSERQKVKFVDFLPIPFACFLRPALQNIGGTEIFVPLGGADMFQRMKILNKLLNERETLF